MIPASECFLAEDESMRAYSFAVLFCVSALLAVAGGCGHRSETLPPPQQSQPGTAEYDRNPEQSQVPAPFATPAYGVGLGVYSGGPAGGPYLYAVCNKQSAVAPATPSSDCYQSPNLMRSVAAYSKSISRRAVPCMTGGSGVCSTSAALSAGMGSLGVTLTDAVSPGSSTPSYQISEGLVANEFFLDSILISSPTLAAGSTATIKVTLTLSGTFNPLCGLAANVTANPVYKFYTDGPTGSLSGSCVSGKLQKLVTSPDGTKTWTGTTWTGQVKMPVAKLQNIDARLAVALNLLDCKQAWNVATCLPGSASGSMKPVANLYIQPVTAGITLSFTSGHSYLPPTPAP